MSVKWTKVDNTFLMTTLKSSKIKITLLLILKVVHCNVVPQIIIVVFKTLWYWLCKIFREAENDPSYFTVQYWNTRLDSAIENVADCTLAALQCTSNTSRNFTTIHRPKNTLSPLSFISLIHLCYKQKFGFRLTARCIVFIFTR